MDPATMAILSSVLPGLMGGKQMGGTSPAFNPVPMGPITQDTQRDDFLKQLMTPKLPMVPALLSGALAQTGVSDSQPAAGPNPGGDGVGPPSPSPSHEAFGPPDPSPRGKIFGSLGSIFNNLDNTFQSPSKTLGIGLLSEINPYLGMAGLLGSGLWGDKLR